ncbi:hypothetical protein [Euryhalocaulis caribicus]|uniref:hypothetical protein n=1 Tax=Euryhalocaulis caribicus TaxID=1161401 RepID=UPI0003A97380|nr:hypothetical protein [Euryhalocaulis caribicus]
MRALPIREMTDKRFTVSCGRCPRLKRYSWSELMAAANPHANEYPDEVARRFRCYLGRYHKRRCPIRMEWDRAPAPPR